MLGSARAAIVATESDRILAAWPSSSGALIEHRGGLPNWSFHALALATRLALGEASAVELQPLANALVGGARSRAETVSRSASGQQSLQGWSWIDGTFSWVEPTAWALLALKKCRARGMAARGAEARIRDGEAILRDRVCVTGGWNYGNSNVFGKNLPAYVPTTAIALLALQDRADEPFVRRSVDFLEEQAGQPSVHAGARAEHAGAETPRPLDVARRGSAAHVAHEESVAGCALDRDGPVRAGGIC